MAEGKKTVKKTDTAKTLENLKKELAKKHQDLVEAKRSHASGELANPHALTEYRKEIARLLTEINSKEIK